MNDPVKSLLSGVFFPLDPCLVLVSEVGRMVSGFQSASKWNPSCSSKLSSPTMLALTEPHTHCEHVWGKIKIKDWGFSKGADAWEWKTHSSRPSRVIDTFWRRNCSTLCWESCFFYANEYWGKEGPAHRDYCTPVPPTTPPTTGLLCCKITDLGWSASPSQTHKTRRCTHSKRESLRKRTTGQSDPQGTSSSNRPSLGSAGLVRLHYNSSPEKRKQKQTGLSKPAGKSKLNTINYIQRRKPE